MGFLSRKTMGLIPLRSVILVVMLMSPILIYALCGAIAIWQVGWMRWLWWLAPLVWSITWIVSKIWTAQQEDERAAILSQHWTPRDCAATEIVRRHQSQAEEFTSDQLSDPQFYFAQALALANDLAKHYHLNSKDPVSDRTLPEILATCRLVADDLERLVLESVPGSRLLTVNHWKKLGGAPKVVRELSKGFWAASVMLNPLSLASWGTSKITNEKVTSNLQTELLVKLYVMFIRQLGFYLIEMNSGRLRAGADLYRSQFNPDSQSDRQFSAGYQKPTHQSPPLENNQQVTVGLPSQQPDLTTSKTLAGDFPAVPRNGVEHATRANQEQVQKSDGQRAATSEKELIRIAILGQKQVGKTSLICGMIGGTTEIPRLKPKYGNQLKPTSHRVVYPLTATGFPYPIELVDTPGYHHAKAFSQLKREIRKAVQQAHAILWVIDPGRLDADLDFSILRLIRQKFDDQPNLKPPPIVVIVMNCDTDQQETLQALQSKWKGMVDDWVELPLDDQTQPPGLMVTDGNLNRCLKPSLEWQKAVQQRVMPIIEKHLDAARTAAMLIAYENLLKQSKYSTLIKQARSSGSKIWSAWFKDSPSKE